MPINKELLLKVKAHILEEPKRLRMSVFYLKKDEYDPQDLYGYSNEISPPVFPTCETVGCIAGWAVYLSGRVIDRNTSILVEALNILGLEDPNSGFVDSRLFYPSHWPKEHADKFFACKTQEGQAVIVGDVIDDFIATNGWDVISAAEKYQEEED